MYICVRVCVCVRACLFYRKQCQVAMREFKAQSSYCYFFK